jgi:hypothetical protein
MYKKKLIYEVRPRLEQIEQAKRMAEALGELNNSIEKGGGNLYGFLGEILVAEAIGARHENSFEYDLVLPHKGGDITIDVKSKHCTSPPYPFYECSVADFNTDQKCDYYVFVRIHKDLKLAWILGKIKRDEFYKKAVCRKKGELDPNAKKEQNYRFHADCYNLAIHDLKPIKYSFA